MTSRGRRGRPVGFKLSDASKRSISLAKKGQKHRPETKDKISKSLVLYFRQKNPLSEEINNKYFHKVGFDMYNWLDDVKEDLDLSADILTEKAIKNKSKMEIACGYSIEYFSHNLTPEIIYLFKEYCEENNIDYDEALGDL